MFHAATREEGMRTVSSIRFPYSRTAAALGVALSLGSAVGLATGFGGGGFDSGGFLLAGTAQPAQDPENSSNDVIRMNTTILPGDCIAPDFQNCGEGSVSRKLNVKITQLDNMLEFKSYFQNRSCGGGSPRIQLAIDLNGDGSADGNAFGYTAPPFAGCLPNRWQYDDVTDEQPRWDVSQLFAGGFPALATICTNPLFSANPVICPIGGFQTHSGYIPWNVFEAVLATLFPLHKICNGALVDDSGWMPAASGVAYYDVISLGRATWVDRGDTAGRGFAQGCRALSDHGDDHHDGDCDHDHDSDHDDREFDRDRHERWDDD
jgi:hypothetical protein